ncbi:MAG: transposase, partial [Candidatus Eisenbacteria bacterium]
IDTVTAVSLVAELHDFRRFPTPHSLMAFLGLVPREHSSGEGKQRGAITRAGNSHARRLLVEAAWHHRHRPAISLPLRRRREGQPARVIALADRAHDRLHRRFIRLTYQGKPTQKAVVAVARELAGFLWVALHLEGIQAQTLSRAEGD